MQGDDAGRAENPRLGRHPKPYRVVLRGELGEQYAAEFEGMTLRSESGKTYLQGEVMDQSHLHGILARIQDLGLDLISVAEVPEGSSPHAMTSHREER